MFTANTMSAAVEAMGMSLPHTSSGPAVTTDNQLTHEKRSDCQKVTDAVFNLLEHKIQAKQIITKEVSMHNVLYIKNVHAHKHVHV